jgi:prepilin-type processing-associated H-X9-DG protein
MTVLLAECQKLVAPILDPQEANGALNTDGSGNLPSTSPVAMGVIWAGSYAVFNDNSNGSVQGLATGTPQLINGGTYPEYAAAHTGGSNYLLCDGHVKWLRATQVSVGINAVSATSPACETSGAPTAAGTSDSSATPPNAATYSVN